MFDDDIKWDVFQDEDSGMYFIRYHEGEKEIVESLHSEDFLHAKKHAEKLMKTKQTISPQNKKEDCTAIATEEMFALNDHKIY